MSIDESIKSNESTLRLPPRQKLGYTLGAQTGWITHYGGLQALASYAGMFSFWPVPFDATWQHGVEDQCYYERYPSDLIYSIEHPYDRQIFVSNAAQQKVLRDLGYLNVIVIGAPFIYAEPAEKPCRIPKSILIMPPHTLDGAPFSGDDILKEYVDFINVRYVDSGLDLWASVHASCVRNGLWVPYFNKYGIKVVGGADHGDQNSLLRMWFLFSSFETVSTPSLGSHVFYALACGCKVIFEGPPIRMSLHEANQDESFVRLVSKNKNPLFDEDLIECRELFMAKFREARDDIELGREALGFQFKKTPEQIRILLGWNKALQVAMMPSYLAKKVKRAYRLVNRILSGGRN